jgi:hypothetical protein
MVDIQDPQSQREPIDATVSMLLDEARWMHDEERLQGERLDNRLGLLAGFAALILALVVPGGGWALAFGAADLFLKVFYLGSIVLLASSALLAISILFRTRLYGLGGADGPVPWRRIGVDDDVLDEFAGELAAQPTAAVERRMTAALVEDVKDRRDLNWRRWSVLRIAALGVGAALVLLVAQGVVAVFA